MSEITPSITQQITDLIANINTRDGTLRDWQGGTVNGGPNNDGFYPLSDALGNTISVPCPAKLADMVSGPAAISVAAKDAAQTAEQNATLKAAGADTAKTLSEAAKGAAIEARDLSQVHRNHAATHAATAQWWAEQAQGQGRTVADLFAQITALSEQVAAHAVEVETNADEAAQSAAAAATFDPALFDLKTDALASARLTGMIDPARIPVLLSQYPVMSLGGLADLTTTQQDGIGPGTIVATTDGKRWAYKGEGLTKTAASGYIEQGDVTPVWDAIADKPLTFTPTAHAHPWSEITGKPNLATWLTNASVAQLLMETSEGTLLGRVYADTSGVGFLGPDGNWRLHASPSVLTFAGNNVWHSGNFDPAVKANINGNDVITVHNPSDGARSYHAEFSAAQGSAARPIDLRFHQHGRWYNRLRGESAGFAVVSGSDDTLVNFRAANITANGSPVWTAATFDPTWKLDSNALANNPTTAPNDLPGIAGVAARYVVAGSTGLPAGVTDGSVLSLAYSSAFATQLFGDWRSNEWHVRGRQNGTWGSWANLWTSANFDPATKAPAVHSHVLSQLPEQLYMTGSTGVTDWDSADATRPGFGRLILGNEANGPGPYAYFHSFNMEYAGSGNRLQFAFPYHRGGSGRMFYRTHYTGEGYSGWGEIWNSDSFNPASKADLASPTFTGVATFSGGATFTGTVYNDNWWRSLGSTGWFNATHSVGIYSVGGGEVRTYNGATFRAEGNLIATGAVYQNGGSNRVPVTTYSQSAPSGGVDGDVHIVW